MLGATDPGRVGLDEALDHPQIEVPPASPPRPAVVAGAPPPALAAPSLIAPAEANCHHQGRQLPLLVLLAGDLLHDRPLDAQQPRPYPSLSHAVSLPPLPAVKQPERVGANGVFWLRAPSGHPRIGQESPITPGGG